MRAILGLAAVLAGATPAAAVLIDVTYTGTVSSGTDLTGIFGTANADLGGVAYTAHFVFDTTLGARLNTPDNDLLYGGAAYGTDSPAVSSDITIRGTTFAVGTAYQARAEAGRFRRQRFIEHSAEDVFNDGVVFTFSGLSGEFSVRNVGSYRIPNTVDVPFSLTLGSGGG